MKTHYIDMPIARQNMLAHFRSMFTDHRGNEEQIISLGFTVNKNQSEYPEKILNFAVSLAGNWKYVYFSEYEK